MNKARNGETVEKLRKIWKRCDIAAMGYEFWVFACLRTSTKVLFECPQKQMFLDRLKEIATDD